MIALSGGWLLTTLFFAWDLGSADPLFWPVLALGLPSPVGLGAGLLRHRKSPEPVKLPRFVGFAVLGGVILTVGVLLVMFGLDLTAPPEESNRGEYPAALE